MKDGPVDAIVRHSTDDDLEAINGIYSHHASHGAVGWELDEPTLEDMRRRRRTILKFQLPYLVCEAGGEIKGFAYAGPFRPRARYRYTVEDSIYIAEGEVGRGFGRALLRRLIDECEKAGYRQMVAVVGDADNKASIELHRRLGFVCAGRLRSSGVKFGRWLDTLLMQRPLGDGDKTPPNGG